VARAYEKVRTDLDNLQLVRDGSRGGSMGDRAAFDLYTDTVLDLAALLPTDFDLRASPTLAHTVRSIADLIRAKDLTDQMRARLYAASLAGKSSRDDYEALTDLRVRQSTAMDQFRADAGPADLARFDEIVDSDATVKVSRLQVAAIDRFRGVGDGVSAEDWWQASTTQVDQLQAVERALLDDARASASALRRATWIDTARISAVIAAVLLLALLLSWMVGRAISRSLRALRTQALEVANITLPAAIDRIRTASGRPVVDLPQRAVRTDDDFGEVSDAFTAVHQRAVNLAVEQATMRHNVNAMFVNLARRSQTLVERQLQLLDRLESAETDPDQLANLFKLDHLATRMRRNDDNLLVLAGSEATRRRVRPVALPAVALAAMAEIDQYERIRHDIADGLYVVGHAVSDLVHLLAELLENATMFSPPDTTVMVTGWLSPDGGGATMCIQDQGIGMTPTGLHEANECVTHPVAIDVAASERMGLIVVGHLAARLGIKVQLRTTGTGVLAYVTLPHRLLSDSPAPVGDLPTDPLVRRSMGALNGSRPDASGPRSTQPDRRPAGLRAVDGAPAVGGARGPVALPSGSTGSPDVVDLRSVGQPRPSSPPPSSPSSPPSSPPSGPAAAPGTPVLVPGVPTYQLPTPRLPRRPLPTEPVPPVPAIRDEPHEAAATLSPGPAVLAPSASSAPQPAAASSSPPLPRRPVQSMQPVQPIAPGPADAAAAHGREETPVTQEVPLLQHMPGPGMRPPATAADPTESPGTNRPPTPMPIRRPARAEAVLDAASGDAPTGAHEGASRWWSRGGGTPDPGAAAPAVRIPAPRQPVDAGTSTAGLPIRVPMAQLPSTPKAVNRPVDEPDPTEVGTLLTRFYSGVQRATVEESASTTPGGD
jgi:signal transduction histidine kinase